MEAMEKKINLSKLNEKLETLTGFDLEAAEMEERAAGNMTPDVSFSKRYQSRLAAKALGCAHDEIQSLKGNEYTLATTMVSNFLFGALAGEAKARQNNIEKSQ
ncbi:MAG: hypothetical protein II767_01800 [Proteobacteria bacterium]|nr:hypothetical protein [Pseudomonadota bacterium]